LIRKLEDIIMPWYKGNLHTHTNKSDGDSAPEVVTNWYEQNGYDFLVLSDHNHLTIFDHKSSLLLIPEKLISGLKPAHLQGQ